MTDSAIDNETNGEHGARVAETRRLQEPMTLNRLLRATKELEGGDKQALNGVTPSWDERPVDEIDVVRAVLSKDQTIHRALEAWWVGSGKRPMTHSEIKASLFSALWESEEAA